MVRPFRFQSTHPSGVRLEQLHQLHRRVRISIHAPQWGATVQHPRVPAAGRISIHAPQWGATGNQVRAHHHGNNFNPRTPVGCDADATTPIASPTTFQSTHPSGVRRQAYRVRRLGERISIHAPQWGATDFSNAGYAFTLNFNPRTPVGCDMYNITGYSSGNIFQSTHPSGVRRPRMTRRTRSSSNFNPRTPVGCDHDRRGDVLSVIADFNPRTPVGCDGMVMGALIWHFRFQSTHPSGVRPV